MTSKLETRTSPDGRFRIDIRTPEAVDGQPTIRQIEVFDATGRLIGRTQRNFYRHEILHFIQQEGRDYLILSENYHGGYGCMDLGTGEKAIFEPVSDTPGQQHWIWAGPAGHDPEGKTLTVSGCYWAWPFERKTFDFSNPMAVPYRELSCVPEEED